MDTGKIKTITKITVLTAVTGILMAASFDAGATILLDPPWETSISPANGPQHYSALTSAISAYNTSHPSTPLPSAGAVDMTPQLVNPFVLNLDGHAGLPTGYGSGPLSITFNFNPSAGGEHETYLTLQWDGPKGGFQAWYVGNETGSITFTSPVFSDGNQHGLSGYMFTGAAAVPEPTTVVAGLLLLLPFGASTLRFIRKNRMA